MINQHPIKILSYSTRNLWLLAFPLIRGLLSIRLNVFEFYQWVKGTWFDLLILMLIIFIGRLRWKHTKIQIGDEKLLFKSGVIIRRETTLAYTDISCVSISQGLFARIIRGTNVFLYTSAAQNKRKPDISLFLRRNDSDFLIKKLPFDISNLSPIYKSGVFQAALLALVLSGRINRRKIPVRSFTFFFNRRTLITILAVTLVLFKSSVYMLLSIAFFIWLMTFILALMRYCRLKIYSCPDGFLISSGAISHNSCYVSSGQVSQIIENHGLLSQSIVTELTVYCGTILHIPLLTAKHSEKHIHTLRPKSLFAYIWMPSLLIALLAFAAFYTLNLFGYAHGFTIFFICTAAIASVYFFSVRMLSFFRSGISFDSQNDTFILNYHKLYRLCHLQIPRQSLVKLTIEQNIIQTETKQCNLVFYFSKRKISGIKLVAIDINDVRKTFKNHFLQA